MKMTIIPPLLEHQTATLMRVMGKRWAPEDVAKHYDHASYYDDDDGSSNGGGEDGGAVDYNSSFATDTSDDDDEEDQASASSRDYYGDVDYSEVGSVASGDGTRHGSDDSIYLSLSSVKTEDITVTENATQVDLSLLNHVQVKIEDGTIGENEENVPLGASDSFEVGSAASGDGTHRGDDIDLSLSSEPPKNVTVTENATQVDLSLLNLVQVKIEDGTIGENEENVPLDASKYLGEKETRKKDDKALGEVVCASNKQPVRARMSLRRGAKVVGPGLLAERSLKSKLRQP